MVRSRRKFLALSSSVAALASCAKKEPISTGADMRTYGDRAPQDKTARVVRELTKSRGVGSSRTPLQDLYGSITPSSLHFERHHSGVPAIDPAAHALLVHGLVERPLVFTMDEIRRFPTKSRILFPRVRRQQNRRAGRQAPHNRAGRPRPGQRLAVDRHAALALVLREAGLKPEAKWIIAEGASTACRMSRSIPIEKALDDVLLVYGQNGEALRPEQGYPLRLIVPGWEGNTNVKWLHRLHVLDQPAMSTEETAHYTDLMPGGKAEMFTFVNEARSVITRPSGGQKLTGAGFHEIVGLAWSGRGKFARWKSRPTTERPGPQPVASTNRSSTKR